MLGAVILLGAIIIIRLNITSASGADPPTLPADVIALGNSVTLLDPAGYLAREDALSLAKPEVGGQFESSKVDAYLIHIEDPSTAGLQDRNVWLIKASGLSISVPGPPPRPGETPVDRRATIAYVFLHAKSGEFIGTALFP